MRQPHSSLAPPPPFNYSLTMSFITKQLLAQSQMDLDGVKATIAAGRSTVELENKLRGLTKHVTHLSKQFAHEESLLQMKETTARAAETSAKAMRSARTPEADPAPMKPRLEDTTLQCCDCECDFVFSGGDQAFFARNGFAAPVRCTECRAAKKAARPQPQEIECCDCKTMFMFSIGQQISFKENGWSAPVRCVECRKAKKTKHTKEGGVKSTVA